MARKSFFSFHYKPDVQRAHVVKNSQVVKDREDAGFLDSSAFERAKNENPESLKRFLGREMDGSSVVCVLIGTETAHRRWVRFEIMQGLWDSRGLVGIRIHNIADWDGRTVSQGPNPFDLLGVYVDGNRMKLIERANLSDRWTYSNDFGERVLPKWPYQDSLPSQGSHALSAFFKVHLWSTTAHNEIGGWLETAATQAGR